MAIGRAKRSAINIGFSLVNRVVAMLLPFAIRTIMIYTIGIVYLGVDSLFSSILNVLSLSELGFSSAIVYAMYKPIAQNDNEKVKALLTFYKKVYRIVGLVILGLGVIILPFIKWFIAEGTEYPQDINIYVVYSILLFNTGISYFLFAYKSSILVATMRNDLESLIDTGRSIISHGLQILALLLFRQYYLYIIILPIVTVLNDLVRNFIIDKRYPQYKGTANISAEDKKDLLTRVGALIGNKIGGVFFTSVDSIVISKFLGIILLAQYTNYLTIYNAVFAIEGTIYLSFQSVIGNSLVVESKEQNLKLFKDLFIINMVFTCICTCCFATLYQPFIAFWVGVENVLPIEIPLMLAIYFFIRSIRRICYVFKEALGMWREDFLKPYVSVIVNLVVNIVLVKTIGLVGVVISSAVAILFIEIPWESTVLFKKYFKMNPLGYFGDMSIAFLLGAICFLGSYYICEYIQGNVFGIILRFIITVAVCLAILLPILMTTKYGKSVFTRLQNLLFKRRGKL